MIDLFIIGIIEWFYTAIKEFAYLGKYSEHSEHLKVSFLLGFYLFIVSEVLFFIEFLRYISF